MERGKKRACTIELWICVVCCCWNLQLNWSVSSDKGTFAGIVAIAAGNAGQRVECRAVLKNCHFHASTSCVFGQQGLEDFLWRLTAFVVWRGAILIVADSSCLFG